jgi:hypothetical protein
LALALDDRLSQNSLSKPLVAARRPGLPTTIQLIGFAIAVFIAADVSRYFGH